MRTLPIALPVILSALLGCSDCGASETPTSPALSATSEGASTSAPPADEQWALESSAPVVSPSGQYNAVVSSQTYSSGDALSQAVVSGPRGGSGLVAFYSARVSMRFEWRTDDELIVSYPDDLPPPRIDATNSSFGFGGRGRVTYQAVPPSDIPALNWTHEASAQFAERESLERGDLVAIEENGETTYSYSYYDATEPDSSSSALLARGFQGGGQSWAGIIHGLVALRAPHIATVIELDPEGDGLSVRSTSRAALVEVAELVAAAKGDGELLDAAIQRAQADGEME